MDIGRKLDIRNDLLRSIKKGTGTLIEGQSTLIEGQSTLIEGQNDIKTILRSMDNTLQKIAEK